MEFWTLPLILQKILQYSKTLLIRDKIERKPITFKIPFFTYLIFLFSISYDNNLNRISNSGKLKGFRKKPCAPVS